MMMIFIEQELESQINSEEFYEFKNLHSFDRRLELK